MINTHKLKYRMHEMEITQAELAKTLGIAQSTCCQKINNIRSISLDEANLISEKLNIEPNDFKVYFFYNPVANCNRNKKTILGGQKC